ncbi:MAG: hypothetical protein WCG25_03660 [bacterium]
MRLKNKSVDTGLKYHSNDGVTNTKRSHINHQIFDRRMYKKTKTTILINLREILSHHISWKNFIISSIHISIKFTNPL